MGKTIPEASRAILKQWQAQGLKFNWLGLVLGGFAKALEEVGKVGTGGAVTYSDNGWKEVDNGVTRYEDAMLRHWIKIKKGDAQDPKTGLLHQAHLAWNALAVLELMLKETK